MAATIINFVLIITGIVVLKAFYFFYLTYNLNLTISNFTNDLGIYLLVWIMKPTILPVYHDLVMMRESIVDLTNDKNFNSIYEVEMSSQFIRDKTIYGTNGSNKELYKLVLQSTPVLVVCPSDEENQFLICFNYHQLVDSPH